MSLSVTFESLVAMGRTPHTEKYQRSCKRIDYHHMYSLTPLPFIKSRLSSALPCSSRTGTPACPVVRLRYRDGQTRVSVLLNSLTPMPFPTPYRNAGQLTF